MKGTVKVGMNRDAENASIRENNPLNQVLRES
jgi:hypothetical protein